MYHMLPNKCRSGNKLPDFIVDGETGLLGMGEVLWGSEDDGDILSGYL